MTEGSNFSNSQPITVNTTPVKKPVNWKLVGIISIIAVIIVVGLGYSAVVLDIFGKAEPAQTVGKKEDQKLAANKVAFIKDNQVWVADSDFTNQQQVTTENRFWRDLNWCPDGTKLVFTGVMVGGQADLFYYDFREKKVNGLATTNDSPNLGIVPLTWSPDCNRYAYMSHDGKLTVGNIKTGQSKVILTADDGYGPMYNFSWSKGEKILLTKTDPSNLFSQMMVIVSSDGKEKKEVKAADTGLADVLFGNSTWGRTDNEVIVTIAKIPSEGIRSKLPTGIYLMLINNPGGLKPLSGLNYVSAKLSPKGSFIAAIHHVTGDSNEGDLKMISIIKYDGTLVKDDITKGLPRGFFWESFSWLPSEDKIAVNVVAGDVYQVWIITIDGKQTRIANNFVKPPVWSPAN